MTHVPLNWPPDRPEFGVPAPETPMSVVVDRNASSEAIPGARSASDNFLADIVSLAIALNYFSGSVQPNHSRRLITKMHTTSSPTRSTTHPWRTAANEALLQRQGKAVGTQSR